MRRVRTHPTWENCVIYILPKNKSVKKVTKYIWTGWIYSHKKGFPNGHTTLNPRLFDVDIRPNFDEFPRHFRVLFWCNFDGRKIHVVSTYFFWCNFAGRKIHVVSTYFFWYNFAGRKIHIVSTYFFRCNFMVQKSTWFPRTFIGVISMVEICTLFLLTFLDVILMGKDLTWFLLSCKLMKTFEKVFPLFVTLNSWLLEDCSL